MMHYGILVIKVPSESIQRRPDMEIETKYSILDPQVYNLLRGLQHLGPYQLADGKAHTFRDTYLDTRDCRLLRAGYACRWRVSNHTQRITVKGLAQGSATAHQREEFEAIFHDADPYHPSQWKDITLRSLVLRLVNDAPLEPLLVLQQTRLTRLLIDTGDEPIAELAVDRFEVDGDPEMRQFLELEIELIKPGTVRQLAPIQQALGQIDGLSWQPVSKFERAILIVAPRSLAASTLGLWGVLPGLPTSEAYRRAMRPIFLQMLIAEPDAYLGSENNAVQAWHEAIRGLNVMSATFPVKLERSPGAFTRKTLEYAEQEVAALTAMEALRKMSCEAIGLASDAPGLTELHLVWNTAYKHHRENLMQFLTGRPYAQLKQRMWNWLNKPKEKQPYPPMICGSLSRLLSSEIAHCTEKGEEIMSSSQPVSTGYRPLLSAIQRLRHILTAFREVLGDETLTSISHLTKLETSLTTLESTATALSHLCTLRDQGLLDSPSQRRLLGPSHPRPTEDVWSRLISSYTSRYWALYTATRDLWYACWHGGARPLLQRQQRMLLESAQAQHEATEQDA